MSKGGANGRRATPCNKLAPKPLHLQILREGKGLPHRVQRGLQETFHSATIAASRMSASIAATVLRWHSSCSRS